MRLERVTLENFRSYKKQTFNLGDLTVLIAPNGAGKTNLLEAIYLLSTGESERAGETGEMIAWGKDVASVAGIVEVNEERQELSIVLTRGAYMGKVTPKRRYLVDGVARTKAKFTGKFPVTLFRPEDMRLIEGSPPRRRAFLDENLSMAHPDYGRALSVYEASLRRRNKLLDAIREGIARREQLSYWDQSIIKNGNIVTDYRRKFLESLSDIKTSFGEYRLEYDASTVSPARLAQYAEAEVAVGYTLVGPHKDDFVVLSSNNQIPNSKQKEINLLVYGSRGEQRLGVLFLKLAAMEYMESKLGVKSVVLLDDIFSELDQVHREEVVKMTAGRQTIVTSAEEEVIKMLPGAEVVRLD
ncbi:MAG: DNA replication and repair protein RecF [bacterium]